MVPNLGGSQQAGPGPQPPLWLESCVCAFMCVHVCTRGTSVQVCTRGGVTSQAGQVGRSRQGLPGVASSQVDSPQVSGRCDGVALRAELLGTLQGEQGGLWLYPVPHICSCEPLGLQPHLPEPAVCWDLGSVLPTWAGEAWAASVSRQAHSCVGETPGSNRLARPAAGAPVMRTRLGPAVAAAALTRLHAAFDQDTEPTSGPFIAVSG